MNVFFSIPGAPKAKQRPRVTRAGIAFTPRETVNYENLIKMIYSEYCHNIKLDGEIKAEITAYYPIPESTSKKKKVMMQEGTMNPTRKPDCDNIAKIVLDALNNIAYHDDSAVVTLSVAKRYSDDPRVDVSLEEIKYITPTFSM